MTHKIARNESIQDSVLAQGTSNRDPTEFKTNISTIGLLGNDDRAVATQGCVIYAL